MTKNLVACLVLLFTFHGYKRNISPLLWIVGYLTLQITVANPCHDITLKKIGNKRTDSGAIIVDDESSHTLHDDIDSILEPVPIGQVVQICVKHLSDDPEVREVYDYLKSVEFKELFTKIENSQEFKNWANYLHEAGFPIYYYLNKCHDWLQMKKLETPSDVARPKRSLRSMIEEIKDCIPNDKIKTIIKFKSETSKPFITFMKKINSQEFKALCFKLDNNSDFQKLKMKLKSKNIDCDYMKEAVREVTGIKILQ